LSLLHPEISLLIAADERETALIRECSRMSPTIPVKAGDAFLRQCRSPTPSVSAYQPDPTGVPGIA